MKVLAFILARIWDAFCLAVAFFCLTQLDQQIRAYLRPQHAKQPTCWARVYAGIVVDRRDDGCIEAIPKWGGPVVRFSYAPLTPEQAEAYRRH